MEGGGNGLIEVLSLHLSALTEENHGESYESWALLLREPVRFKTRNDKNMLTGRPLMVKCDRLIFIDQQEEETWTDQK